MPTKTWAVTIDAVAGNPWSAGACAHLDIGVMGWMSPGNARSFLKFAVEWSGVVQITKAELHIRTSTGYHTGPSYWSAVNCYVDLVTGSWAEGGDGESWGTNSGGITWGGMPSVNTGYRATFQPRSASTWYVVDITAIANRWAPSSVKQSNGSPGPGATNYGIRLMSDSEGSGTDGHHSEFSSRETSYDAYIVLTYTTNQPPVVQSLDSPGNGVTITDDTPDLVFTCHDPDAADTVAKYDIQVDTDSAFGSPDVNVVDQAIGSPANTVQVTHTSAALTRGYTYYWRARCTDNQGSKGDWSAARQFYLATQPTTDQRAPTADALAVIHNLGETALWTDGAFAKPRLQFRYNSSSGLAMASYRVRVYTAASGGTPAIDTGVVALSVPAGSTVQVNLSTAIARASARYWTVEVVDSAGGNSGESTPRDQFHVQWGQALYQANPGAASSAWSFDPGAVAGGSAAFAFRTASQDGSGGSFGTTSGWVANIADLDEADWLNVVVRLSPAVANTNVTLGSMLFQYLAGATTPDHWVRSPSAEWALSTAQRRFGSKSLKCSVVAGTTGNRFAFPFRNTSGDDIPVVPGVKYTWSVYVYTPVALTGGTLSARVYRSRGDLTIPDADLLAASAEVATSIGQPDGWARLVVTLTVPGGVTSVRPVVHYQRASGVTEAFYADGAKLEEGPVATPWQAGAIGAVILDSGGIAIDLAAGGTFRLRGQQGGDRDTVDLGPHGFLFGGDTQLYSDATGELLLAGPAGQNSRLRVETPSGQRGSVRVGVAGDGYARLAAYGDATVAGIELGPGNAATDVRLRRSAAKVLTLDDAAGGAAILAHPGLVRMGGTSFPSSPSDSDLFYRADIGEWFAYKSAVSKWLGALHAVPFMFGLASVSAVSTVGRIAPLKNALVSGALAWVEGWAIGGDSSTAQTTSNYWNLSLMRYYDDGSGNTALDTRPSHTVNPTANRWQTVYFAIDALLGSNVANLEFQVQTGAGAPGTIFLHSAVFMRLALS